MPTSYTSLLGLALPVTGELSGTWGDTVNNYITQYLDSAVDGTQTISGSQTSVTLSVTTNAALSQVGAGATGSAQYAIVNCTGNPASTLTITAPASSRQYLVLNSTSTSQSVVFRGSGPTTGVTLVSGERCIVAWNGSDFVKVATSVADGVTSVSGTGTVQGLTLSGTVTSTGSLTLGGSLSAVSLTSQVSGTLPIANGGTNATATPTAGAVAYGTGTAYAFTSAGSSGQVLTSGGAGAPTWSSLSSIGVTTFSAGTTGLTPSTATSGAVTLAGTLATTNGGTGLTSFTANRVFYSSSTSAIGSSANLTFDGTTLTANALTTTSTVTINGGTANGVAYLNGSKVLTTGSALSFDGTTFIATGAARVKAVSSGDQIRIEPGSAGSGVSLLSRNAADNDLTPLLSYGSYQTWYVAGGARAMDLTTTGLGIGTSSPGFKLDVAGAARSDSWLGRSNTSAPTADAFIYRPADNTIGLGTANTERLRIDSSGNLGLGVTPSAWGAAAKAFEISTGAGATNAGLFTINNDSLYTLFNCYWDGTNFRYKGSSTATLYLHGSYAQHKWGVAASGTAGNIISFTTAMTLDCGTSIDRTNLLIGTTSGFNSAAGRGNISVNGSSDAIVALGFGGTRKGYLYAAGSQVNLGSDGFLVFETSGSERARITSVGNLSLGGTADRGTTVGTNAIQIFNGTAPAGTLTNGVSLYSSSGDLNFMNSAGNGFRVGYRNLPPVGTQTGSYTLAAGDVGKYVQVSTGGSITIPTSVFAEGDAISIYNNTTGNITITCSAPTAYIAGTNTVKTSMTLATRGVATVLFYSATACVVSGNVT